MSRDSCSGGGARAESLSHAGGDDRGTPFSPVESSMTTVKRVVIKEYLLVHG